MAIMQQARQDKRLCRKFKKRHRKDLSSTEVAELVRATKEPYRLHKDIAKEFQVPVSLVSRFAKESVREPEKLDQLRQREEDTVNKKLAIEEAATEMLEANVAITRTRQVQDAVQRNADLEVSAQLVSRVMRKDLHLGYRLAKTVAVQCNTERCLVLRQQFALHILPLLEAGHRIINVNETWLNGTRFLRRVWTPTDAPATFNDKQVAPRISVIAALDTAGHVYCALTQATTDSDVMCTFLRHLKRQLDQETPGWEENSTILVDNASWHTSPTMQQRLFRM